MNRYHRRAEYVLPRALYAARCIANPDDDASADALDALLRGRGGHYRLPRGGRTGAFALAVKEWAAIDTDAIDTGAP